MEWEVGAECVEVYVNGIWGDSFGGVTKVKKILPSGKIRVESAPDKMLSVNGDRASHFAKGGFRGYYTVFRLLTDEVREEMAEEKEQRRRVKRAGDASEIISKWSRQNTISDAALSAIEAVISADESGHKEGKHNEHHLRPHTS